MRARYNLPVDDPRDKEIKRLESELSSARRDIRRIS